MFEIKEIYMLNNAFFNVVFYNTEPLNYIGNFIYKSIDHQNYKEYKYADIDVDKILYDVGLIDTLCCSVAPDLPDIEWEYQYVSARVRNYYKALINVASIGFKAGILKRVNIFYPFIRTTYIDNPSLHGSTIYTFITEIIYNDNQSILCVSEEIPDDFEATTSFKAANEYVEKLLFCIRYSSFITEKYKYHHTDEPNNTVFVVNYILSDFLGINLKFNIKNAKSRIVAVSDKCDFIESCDYKDSSCLTFAKSNSIVLLNNSTKNKKYDEFAYKSYDKFFSYVTFLDSQNTYLKYSIAPNCLSTQARFFADCLRKYINIQKKRLNIKPIKNIDAMNREHKQELIDETTKEIINVAAGAAGTFLSNYNQ